MNYSNRYNRLRLLIKKLHQERKKQAKQIDILCNDFIAAQRNFIKKLNTIGFTADLYESIIGTTDLTSLLYTASKLIKEKIPDTNVSFFLRHEESFELHKFEDHQHLCTESQHLENCFSPELVNNICKSNKPCSINDMFALGLQGNLNVLNKISAATIPLGIFGSSLGFILIYRPCQNKLTADEINTIHAATVGLSQAIASCQALLHSAD